MRTHFLSSLGDSFDGGGGGADGNGVANETNHPLTELLLGDSLYEISSTSEDEDDDEEQPQCQCASYCLTYYWLC